MEEQILSMIFEAIKEAEEAQKNTASGATNTESGKAEDSRNHSASSVEEKARDVKPDGKITAYICCEEIDEKDAIIQLSGSCPVLAALFIKVIEALIKAGVPENFLKSAFEFGLLISGSRR